MQFGYIKFISVSRSQKCATSDVAVRRLPKLPHIVLVLGGQHLADDEDDML